ncbi:hypothetical protein CXB51_008340 [Gossypium anomalum]|uniref:DUF4283 domain-containing protein n=1 Tax=Gossypium anomalum TaxID=47600 RepID=A0A8J5ZJZ5_9ROSI|nr:hypothetical protein CXB51_008340 [Gossypium anomalum]
MCNSMANLRHFIGRVVISDLGEKKFLFQFFSKVDIMRVITGSSWTFNNHLIVCQRLVTLAYVDFWVREMIFLLICFRIKWQNNLVLFLIPLKCRKHIALTPQKHVYGRFQYKKLVLFYFICSKFGHSESFYLVQIDHGAKELSMG